MHRTGTRHLLSFRKLKISIPRLQEENGSMVNWHQNVPTESSSAGFEFAKDYFLFESGLSTASHKTNSVPIELPKSLLPYQENNTLPYKNFPKDIPTPYEVLDSRKQAKTLLLGLVDGRERLSVSSLSSGWCELQKLYDIYSSFTMVQTKEMSRGTEVHKELETQAHPIINTEALIDAYVKEAELHGVSLLKEAEEDHDIQTDISLLIASDPSFPIAEQITRLLSLLTTGEAREIRVLAFIDPETFEILDHDSYKTIGSNEKTRDELVMISGIIDHLTLRSLGNPDDWSMHEELKLYENDLTDFFTQAPEILSDSKNGGAAIIVSDVKTRGWRRLPTQLNVLRANEFQIFCYRKFLGMMGGQSFVDARKRKGSKNSSVEFCYRLLCENYQRRNLDLDAPIAPKLILHLLLKNPSLIADAVRLHSGEDIGFAPYDNHPVNEIEYDLSGFKDIKNYNHDYSILDDVIFDKWKKPFTIRFLLFRLAQFYELMEPYLSDKCSIEYVLRQEGSLEPFQSTYHQFNNRLVNVGLKHSAKFYLSKESEKVHLISPKNFATYCEPSAKTRVGGCRHRPWCGWYQENKLDRSSTTI